jgi:PAS domain S-box-containing protein
MLNRHALSKPWPTPLVYLIVGLIWLWPVVQAAYDAILGNQLTPARLADVGIASLIALMLLYVNRQFNIHLREQEIRLFKSNPQPLWIYELDTLRFSAVNDAAIALYGYSEKEFLQMQITHIRPEEDVPALVASTESIKQNFKHRYHQSGTWRHRKKNNELVYVEIFSHEIFFNGRRSEFVLIHDVTEQIMQDQKLHMLNQQLERKVMERTNDLLHLNKRLVDQNKVIKSANLELFTLSNQLQEANTKIQEHADLKSRFVSMASHEFRTPLANIAFSAGFIRHHFTKLDQENILSKLQGIETQVAHMASLLDDVLTIGKSNVTQIELKKNFVDLACFLEKISCEVQVANNNSHEIHVVISKTVDNHLYTDERFLRNIFINLLTNAVKYSPERSEVYVSVYREGSELCFEIADRGMGISKEDQEKIFEPFYRTGNTNGIQGTGLGLSIVKRAVELLDAKMYLESEVGVGSTFTVIIPVASEQ